MQTKIFSENSNKDLPNQIKFLTLVKFLKRRYVYLTILRLYIIIGIMISKMF